MIRKIKITIDGVHCQSCKTLIESEVGALPGVKFIEVDYLNKSAELEFDDAEISRDKIYAVLKKLNYAPAESRSNNKDANGNQFMVGLIIPVVLGLLLGVYFLFSKLGGFEILSRLNDSNIGYGLIFLIGLLASFHCIGMCGGLVVTYTTLSLKNQPTRTIKPHFYYNAGRFISYTVIGGILGGLGGFFGINPVFTGIIMLVAGSLMILMGLSFVTNWPILEKIKVKTPTFIAKYLFSQKHSQNPKSPLIIGLLNGFMPCGPLQAMQLYALASGSFTRGALSLAVYALGTIPLMFGLGIFLTKISHKFINKVLKISGIIVIILGIIMLSRGLINLNNSFTLDNSKANQNTNNNANTGTQIKDGYQEVRMTLGAYGYEPNTLYVKKGIPVRWIIDVKQMSGCTNSIRMDDYDINKKLDYGENIIEFTPTQAGEIKFSCGMRMVWGKFIVTD